jgi:SAM-dependent methyltransferase
MSIDEPTNTYFLDPENPAEMARLINQDRVTTQAMGGVFAGLSDQEVASLQTILDLACGPGGWALDVAFAHRDKEIAGVDVSRIMIDYANARARTQHLTNVSFGVMDLTQHPLDFSDQTFDLINNRFLVGVLKRDQWAPLLAECMRLLRPGGIIRLTEMVESVATNSPAYERLNGMLSKAMWRSGYGFSHDGRTLDLTFMLPRLLRNAGYRQVHSLAHVLEYEPGTAAWSDFYRNAEIGHYLAQTLLIKTGIATQEELEPLYQQMLVELRSSDFCSMWHLVTVIGYKPS